MYDFLKVKKEFSPKAQRWIYTPAFEIKRYMKDLFVRSKDFYAMYDYATGMWIKNESLAIEMIDDQVREYVLKEVGEQIMNDPDHCPIIKRIADTDNRLIDKWHKFVQKDIRDSYQKLNQKVKFSNSEIKREDYATYKLPYPIKEGPTPYYDKLVNTLYLPEEKKKFEYLAGALIAGEQSKIQKFFVFYGEPGSGKSTIIDIIVDTILGGDDAPYAKHFTAVLLVNKDQFGTEFLADDPILAFDDEAKLDRVETCSTINTIVSHETVRVNPKFGRTFPTKPNCFLVCGSNDVVQLSPNSGFNRRLIDIRPTGEKLPAKEYDECKNQLKFERGAIAAHCLSVYKSCGKNYYNHYQPEDMLTSVSPFHNFVKDNYFELRDGTTLINAYNLYKSYAVDCNFKTIATRYRFADDLKLYFDYCGDKEENGKIIHNWYEGFKDEKIGLKKFVPETEESMKSESKNGWLEFNCTESLFDKLYSDCPAQYAKEDGSPVTYWDNVTTTLKDLDTHKTHYILTPGDVVTMDFDLKDANGNKSLELNLKAANEFPPTYAELSKSGVGIHLEYKWTGGNPDDLSRVYGDNIEVKVSKGKSALRRRLTKCNDLPIAELSSGLPLREGGKGLVDQYAFKNEATLKSQIVNALSGNYKNLVSHKTTIDFIDHLLKEARQSGIDYDVSELYPYVDEYAEASTHQSEYCKNLVRNMFFKSKNADEEKPNIETPEFKEAPIVFFDIESYPEDKEKNMPALFIVCYKLRGPGKPVIKMINPSPLEVWELIKPGKYRLIGFNNRDYDNHMLYGRAQGLSIAELNRRSQIMINGKTADERNSVKFREAWNLSYADVFDFAAKKQSLKKWEIELHETHKEMGISWNEAAPMDRWEEIADYCANDVLATEAVFEHCQGDFQARIALAELSGLTVNDPNRKHIIKIVVGDEKTPKLVYTDFATGKQTEGR